jgi:hypothetical protein
MTKAVKDGVSPILVLYSPSLKRTSVTSTFKQTGDEALALLADRLIFP